MNFPIAEKTQTRLPAWMKKTAGVFFPYIILYLSIWVLYGFLYQLRLVNNEAAICMYMRGILLLLLGYGGILALQKKLTMHHIIQLCILGGIVMRMGYTFYTPWYIRSHDMGEPSEAGTGHIAYIFGLYYHNALPSSYEYQFYQPPFFYVLSALHMKFFAWLHPDADIYTLLETTKLISCFSSCCSLLFVERLCRELKCRPEMTGIVAGIMAFHPSFYLLAGRANNDALSTACMLFAIWMLAKWFRSRSFPSLMGMALGIGLGMMTKLNVATIAFIAGPVMLYVLWQSIQNKNWKKTFAEYLAFLAVCAPLGLWYSIRNLILFGQPLGYVHNCDAEVISYIYCGNYSPVQRFFSFAWKQCWQNIYITPGEEYNLPSYLLRSSLFGEFSFQNMDVNARLLILVNMVLILLSLAAMVAVLWKGKKFPPALRFGVAAMWLVVMASFIIFNIKYPDSCTMDFRYIAPTAVCGSIYLAAFWQQMRSYSQNRDKKDISYLLAKGMVFLLPACCIIFAMLSAYMFSSLS